ncbi:MAG: Flp family type IVb pilin [Acidocella sp.]|nr:Flp family type IVb pilin [Acidocella sp.]
MQTLRKINLCLSMPLPALGWLAASLSRLRESRRAVTSIEYVIIASLIALVIVGSVTAVGSKLPASFNSVASEL